MVKDMRIFLIRHGESEQNVNGCSAVPDPDVCLTEKGKKQANETGKKLKKYLKEHDISLDNARMWVSPYLRTMETSEIINKHLNIKDVFQDPRIVEKDFGNFDVYNRVSGFIETIFRDNNDPLFIVCHGATMRCFIMRWLHKDIQWYYVENNPNNASVILIDKKEGNYYYETIIQ